MEHQVEHLVEQGVLEEVQVMMEPLMLVELEDLLKKQSLVFLEMTTPYLLRFQKHLFFVMAKWMEDITQTLKQNARHSTFVPMMELEDSQNIAFFALMEPSSISNTLSVIGGLT